MTDYRDIAVANARTEWGEGGAYLLRYVCKWCGKDCGTFNVRTNVPAVLTVCDRRECRESASLSYRA